MSGDAFEALLDSMSSLERCFHVELGNKSCWRRGGLKFPERRSRPFCDDSYVGDPSLFFCFCTAKVYSDGFQRRSISRRG